MNGTRTPILPISQVDIFWAKVDRSGGPDSCWPWTGAANKVTGYGVFHPSRTSGYPRTVTAHRFAASLAGVVNLGDPSEHVDHACHNGAGCPPGPCPHRLCCNPRHHRPTGLSENVNNSHNANKWKTHCPKGHEYTPENTRTQAKQNTISRKCIACEQERDRARAPRRSA